MPRTVDHIVATHQAATERRNAGLPIWDRKLNLRDVFHNDDLTFIEKRDAIVRIIRSSGWPDRNSTVYLLVDELADAEATDDFDGVWDLIYDEADADRVWIETR